VALGSLVVTIAALLAAPQVFVFVKMTGYSAGLDRARAPSGSDPTRTPRLLTVPMLAWIVLGFVCVILGLALV
jgi:disulfide bond formation protein DsbB